jgi:hypothetical protein
MICFNLLINIVLPAILTVLNVKNCKAKTITAMNATGVVNIVGMSASHAHQVVNIAGMSVPLFQTSGQHRKNNPERTLQRGGQHGKNRWSGSQESVVKMRRNIHTGPPICNHLHHLCAVILLILDILFLQNSPLFHLQTMMVLVGGLLQSNLSGWIKHSQNGEKIPLARIPTNGGRNQKC